MHFENELLTEIFGKNQFLTPLSLVYRLLMTLPLCQNQHHPHPNYLLVQAQSFLRRPPLFFLGASMGVGRALIALTGAASCSLSILVSKSRSKREESKSHPELLSFLLSGPAECWKSCRQTCFTSVWKLYFLFIIIIPSIICSLASFSEPVRSRWKPLVPTA